MAGPPQPVPSRSSSIVKTSVQQFSGPLPPPEVLREFDQIIPGAAERILSMAEQEGVHRRELEKRIVRVGTHNDSVGMYLATLVAICFMGVAAYAIQKGYTVSAVIIALAEIVALAIVHVSRKSDSGKTGEPPSPKSA